MRTQATTVFLCTSRPQHRSCTTCIPSCSFPMNMREVADAGCGPRNNFPTRAHLPEQGGDNHVILHASRVSFRSGLYGTTVRPTSGAPATRFILAAIFILLYVREDIGLSMTLREATQPVAAGWPVAACILGQ